KKHARTCKKLPVASFCASETAETGRIANGREQGDHVSRRRRSPATSIQIAGRYVILAEITSIHQVTGYAENCNFPGIAGNDLNRCEVRALQHKIRAKMKRTAAFFANSRLRMFGMGGGGQKRKVFFTLYKAKRKTTSQRTAATISHYTQTNAQLQISSATTYCELAVHLFIFGKNRSCVCTTATLLHRFKAFTPPFCGQNRFRYKPPEFSAKLLPAEL
ncbi:MAG: hypothetical protein ACOYIO_10210, partial [Eubacteriales bacterium]